MKSHSRSGKRYNEPNINSTNRPYALSWTQAFLRHGCGTFAALASDMHYDVCSTDRDTDRNAETHHLEPFELLHCHNA